MVLYKKWAVREGREDEMKINGEVSISPLCTGGIPMVRITIKDKNSKIKMIHGDLTMENWGRAISGQSMIPCDVDYVASDNVGKQRETKAIHINRPVSYDKKSRKEEIRENLPDLEGWKIWDDGTGMRQEGKKWKIILCRYVERVIKNSEQN